METGYCMLRTKEVVNVNDGHCLGKVCDIIFTYPEGSVMGIVVPGSRKFWVKREKQFIDLRSIVKIGDDVILVDVKVQQHAPKPPHGGPGCYCPPKDKTPDRRNYDEYE